MIIKNKKKQYNGLKFSAVIALVLAAQTLAFYDDVSANKSNCEVATYANDNEMECSL